MRRIVTVTGKTGRSVIQFDDAGSNDLSSQTYPGLVMHELWATSETPAAVSASRDRAIRPIKIEPDSGGSIFRVIELPPDEAIPSVNPEESHREFGLSGQKGDEAGHRHHSIHRTSTIDYLVVLSGEMWMLLDDCEVLLTPGTCVVQQAASHGFSNRSRDYCVFAAVLLDAAQEETSATASAPREAGDRSPSAPKPAQHWD